MQDPLGFEETFASIQVSADTCWCRKVRKKRNVGAGGGSCEEVFGELGG